jgi:predicted transcriptional regulator
VLVAFKPWEPPRESVPKPKHGIYSAKRADKRNYSLRLTQHQRYTDNIVIPPIYVNEPLLARLERFVERLAVSRQTDRNALLSEAVEGYLEQEEQGDSVQYLFPEDIATVHEGIADMEAGRTISFTDYVHQRQAARRCSFYWGGSK